ncbi:MAG TPA: glycosyltransferase family 2 protein [Candidatus Limnocylindria bacterium]|jgi:glycosyltransferase involved in cell wall biosynthesis|nr:glycosyltransferase family 2 protein [Candidatus Limnocylindria bacterium]
MPTRPKITALIHTWNEAANIATCLRSVAWADECVVADMASTDATVEVARSLGARVIAMPAKEYNVEALRNQAVAACDEGWIIIVDADETIPPTLAERLCALASSPTAEAYSLPRKNYFLGEWLRHGFWPDYQPRFVKTGVAHWNGEAHQHPQIEGRLEELPADPALALEHPGYGNDLTKFLIKLVNYSLLEAQRMQREGAPAPWPWFIRRPLTEFHGRYFVNGGWHDGMPGLVHSLLRALYQFLIGIRLWELTRKQHPEPAPATLRRQVRWEGLRATAKWLRF